MQSAHCLHGYRHGSQRTAGVEWLGSSAGRTKIIMAVSTTSHPPPSFCPRDTHTLVVTDPLATTPHQNQQSLFKLIHGLRGFGVGQRVVSVFMSADRPG